MKRKYLGLSKAFFSGYKQLNEDDFFQLGDEVISGFNLADRANLWFKIGNFISVPIERGEETDIINLIANTETFADVLIAAEALYEYCKKEKEQQQKVANLDSLEQQQQNSNSPANQISEEPSDSEQEDEFNSTEPQQDESYGGTAQGDQSLVESKEDKEPEVRTADSLAEKINELVNFDGTENVYVEVPKVNLETIVGKNADVHKDIDSCFNQQQKSFEETLKNNYKHLPISSLFENADTEFKKFKISAQKEVNYLVKEFECKKAADSYARATTARTGVLDCSKLHTYSTTKTCSRKSLLLLMVKHGLVFVLDWSGSMQNVFCWILASNFLILCGSVKKLRFLLMSMLSQMNGAVLNTTTKLEIESLLIGPRTMKRKKVYLQLMIHSR